MTARVPDAEWEALRTGLGASAPRPKQAGAATRAAGLAVWTAALMVGLTCLAVYIAQPSVTPHHYRPPAVTACAAPCAHHPGVPGKVIGGYVIGRAARGILRVPFRAARGYLRYRMYAPRIAFVLPSWGG